jgi:hypothetical protein
MKRPVVGEVNLGALVGAVVGSVGGLLAVGAAPAILARNPALLFGTPILALAGWLIAGLLGWFLGGQLGPRLGAWFHTSRAEALGGALGGLIPAFAIAAFGWYLITRQ